MKKLLALMLTLVLALTLALPAMAEVDWDEFRITAQPQDLTIIYGDSFTLSVEVNVPDGVEVEYQWYRYDGRSSQIEGATTPELCLGPDNSNYPDTRLGGAWASYHCKITAYEKNGENEEIASRFLNSSIVSVTMERTPLGKLFDLIITPFVYAFGGTLSLSSMFPGIIIPFLPFIFFGGLILGFVEGVKGLF